jgi:hypothetical protein
MSTRRSFIAALSAGAVAVRIKADTPFIQSARSGPWSSPSTWQGNQVPPAGSKVQILPKHTVVYDRDSDQAIRMLHVTGNLTFSRDRNTRLDVGLLKIGGDSTEDGFNLSAHNHAETRPSVELGTANDPIPAGHTALIRLVYFEGLDKESFPSIVCCGGRLDLHGAPLSRTWVKLGAPAQKGDLEITLAEGVTGWRPGDQVIVTATTRQNKIAKTYRETVRDNTQTEERVIKSVNGDKITLTEPLTFDHVSNGVYRGEVANLSRNVIIESADPKIARGHTMYHYGSAGSISYAELRHLGKENVLGRYSLHFHLVRNSMRGSSIIGASIWDSGNRWITVHGTDYLVVRDCVGYNSIGHGFFLEDGTEVFNVFDRNLAVQARVGKILPNQVLPFDHNDGAGFWWGNSRNTFTRNVACECDEYGYRGDIQKTATFDPELSVPQPDGTRKKVDVRTLSFVRFEDNESHTQRRHAFNLVGLDSKLKGGCSGVGPDEKHPYVIKNMRVWDAHWSFHTLSPCVLVDQYDIFHAEYAMWNQNYDRHSYRGIHLADVTIDKDFSPKGKPPQESEYPNPLAPVDDLPPQTVITHVGKPVNGKILVRGTTSDCGPVKSVQVNGQHVKALRPDFAEWEVTLDASTKKFTVRSEDVAGNVA